MPNDGSSRRAICPFFTKDDLQVVLCEGFEKGTKVRMWFSGKRLKERWMEEKCFAYAFEERCPLALALLSHYERRLEEKREAPAKRRKGGRENESHGAV